MSNIDLYIKNLVKDNSIKLDQAQLKVIKTLNEINLSLTKKSSLFGIRKNKYNIDHNGIYLYGSVGRGKSMIMNEFYNQFKYKKHKIHFNQFMYEVHGKIHEYNKKGGYKKDSLQLVAKDYADKYNLIYIDEMQVTNIADAMIIGRLFKYLAENKILIVTTSNFAPNELYKDGLQREYFLDFIAFLKETYLVINLDGPHDYRATKIKSMNKTYFYSLGREADQFIHNSLKGLIGEEELYPQTITSLGREIVFEKTYKNILSSSFDELCKQPLGSYDYNLIAKQFKIVIIENIPILKPEDRNEAKRFVNLIDELYQNNVILIASFATDYNKLYPSGDELMQFSRCISRLKEMESEHYLKQNIG